MDGAKLNNAPPAGPRQGRGGARVAATREYLTAAVELWRDPSTGRMRIGVWIGPVGVGWPLTTAEEAELRAVIGADG